MALEHTRRYALISQFRAAVYDHLNITLFPHQIEWQLATEGWVLIDAPPLEGQPCVDTLIPAHAAQPTDDIIETLTINDILCVKVRRLVVPRINSQGDVEIAHNVSDLAAYKTGKSYSAALWATGFAALPDGRVQFIGLEYSTSEPEFNYLLEFLCSERGMNMRHDQLQNDVRGGRMILKLRNGAYFEVKSWNQKEALKGKRNDAHIYTEAYQLPGFEVYSSIAQNLRQRRGFAVFTTTPDRPWVSVLHEMGHGKDSDWHCTCGVDAHTNPFTFDQRARDRDDPEKGGMMTREKFAISWQGKLGSFVGRVYDYQRGQHQFTPLTHPYLWNLNAIQRRQHAHA